MRNFKLTTKILIVSILVLIIFSLASGGILFRALANQSTRNMDQLLQNETLALSALVNLSEDDNFEFEMPTNFLEQFRQRNPNGFFRFIDPRSGKVLMQSEGAPAIVCNYDLSNTNIDFSDQSYRVETYRFQPESDSEDATGSSSGSPSRSLCLVAGLNRAPYWRVLTETLWSAIPVLLSIMVFLVCALLVLIRSLTKDLLALMTALTSSDFRGTHAFPILPRANTQEVKAITAVLENLHQQAASVYREIWLFMGRAAHQIKTPVTAMQATLEVLLRKERTKDELLAGLKDVQSAAYLLSDLTRKLMVSSRISYEERPATEAVQLLPFITELTELFSSQAKLKRARFQIEIVNSLSVVGHRSLMSDIFGNLLENAILYTPAEKETCILISAYVEGSNVVVEVSDQGPGFPQTIRPDLFKPFIRGDERATRGSGLGLSIAKKSANLLDGDIKLAESSACGSKLRVWLPRYGALAH